MTSATQELNEVLKENPTNKMSLQSETTMTSGEDVDIDLEETVWNLLSKTGLLADIKGQISKFIQDNGKVDQTSVSVIPDRADGNILTFIYEYLQWIGMKNTCGMMLSESPVEIFTKVIEPENKIDPNYRPALHNLFQKSDNQDEKSFNEFSFEVQKMRDSVSSKDVQATGDEISFLTTPLLNKTYVTAGVPEKEIGKTPQTSKTADIKLEHEGEANFEALLNNGIISKPLQTTIPTDDETDGEIKKETEEDDSNNISDLSETEQEYEDEINSNKKESEAEASNPSKSEFESDISKSENSESDNAPKIEKSEHVADMLKDANHSATEISKSEKELELELSKSEKEASAAEPSKSIKSESDHFGEESISELLEGLSLDNNTEDITIASEGKDMSSCDHLIKLS